MMQASDGLCADTTTVLLQEIRLTQVLPCLADNRKIRFHAEPSADLTDVLPYLNTVVSGAIYNHAAPALTFTKEQRIICLFPRLITGAKAEDVNDACAVLDWLRDLINNTWARREQIAPSYERRERLTVLSIYKLLPGASASGDFLGCRRCGAPTCLAFALEVAAERMSVLRCAPLFSPAFAEKRRLLLQLLAAAGYEVPSAFRPATGD